jgi:hypothetical protein
MVMGGPSGWVKAKAGFCDVIDAAGIYRIFFLEARANRL